MTESERSKAEDAAIQSPAPAQPPSTAVTDAAPVRIPPPQAAPRNIDRVPLQLRNLDRVLVGLVLMLAFLLGAFAVQNSDLWLHLAIGRAVAHGNYTFGTNPFSYTSTGVYWVNHSWLFDWLLYLLYDPGRPWVLSVCRGLLCVALAAVLLGFRGRGDRVAIPSVCAVLALVGVSFRLPMNSLTISYVLLALTLLLLYRGVHLGATVSFRGRSFSLLWLLPPLFALWVNLDAWFVLGPLCVALFLLGSGVQRLAGRTDGPPLATLALVLLAGLAACLLNPYLHRAFVLPLDLAYLWANVLPEGVAPGGAATRQATAVLPQLFATVSPFTDAYWSQASVGRNVAGLVYFVLLLLGGASFALRQLAPGAGGKGAKRDEGAAPFPVGLYLVWLLFAALSALQFRLVPFYAVVAGPVCAVNLTEFARRRFGVAGGVVTPGQRSWLVGGRVAAVLACLLLLFVAWPGWLHAAPDDARRSHHVHLGVQVDPLLPRAAARLDELLATGKLHRGFNLTPDVAYYWAWFAGPQAQTFFDQRFSPFPQAAATYARVRQDLHNDTAAFLSGRREPKGGPRLAGLHEVFRDYDINYLVLGNLLSDQEMTFTAARLLADPGQWPLLYADGRTAIFGWRDPRRADDPFAGLRVDFNQLAFGPPPAVDSGMPGRPAPEEGPTPPEGPPGFWARWLAGPAPTAPSASEARFYLLAHQFLTPRWQRWHSLQLNLQQPVAWTLSPVGASGVVPAPVAAPFGVRLVFAPQLQQATLAEAGSAFEALPLLAMRAARRGIAENPTDPDTYLCLADAYRLLARTVEERWAPARAPVSSAPSLFTRQGLRHVQTIFALSHALALRPHDARLHLLLAETLEPLNYPDAVLDHLEEATRYLPLLRKGSAADRAFVEQAGPRLDKQLNYWTGEVERRRQEYELHSAGQRALLGKFMVALKQPTKWRAPDKRELKVSLGLALLGVKLLREVDMTKLPEEERAVVVDQQLRLTLCLGMSQLAQEQFSPTIKAEVGKLAQRLQARQEGSQAERAMRQQLARQVTDNYATDEALYAAALGRYAAFDRAGAAWAKDIPVAKLKKELDELGAGLEKDRKLIPLLALPGVPLVPALAPLPAPRLTTAIYFSSMLNLRRQNVALPLYHAAELLALRGMMALERGDTEAASSHFAKALDLAGPAIVFPSRGIVEGYRWWLKRSEERTRGARQGA